MVSVIEEENEEVRCETGQKVLKMDLCLMDFCLAHFETKIVIIIIIIIIIIIMIMILILILILILLLIIIIGI